MGQGYQDAKKAIRDLASIGTPALIHLEEEVVLSVVPRGEVKIK